MRVTCGPTHATNVSSTTTTSPSTSTTIRLPQLTHDLLSGTTTTTIRPAETTEVLLSPPLGTLFLGLNLDTIGEWGGMIHEAVTTCLCAFLIIGTLSGESSGGLQKANNTELLCFLCFSPNKLSNEQSNLPVVEDSVTSTWRLSYVTTSHTRRIYPIKYEHGFVVVWLVWVVLWNLSITTTLWDTSPRAT